ncbi:MAG: hypothetical protein IPJ13_17895 [Saprospiraceae bacterium]|nr:hypothetical protein [Saprospiraceae bacterium]
MENHLKFKKGFSKPRLDFIVEEKVYTRSGPILMEVMCGKATSVKSLI